MGGFDLLGIAIGMIFVYLLLSLLCTALFEIIESFLKHRASDLEKGIRLLLSDAGVTEMFYRHPLVNALYDGNYAPTKTTKNLPTYIPARNFALALMDIVLPADQDNPSGAAGAVASSFRPARAARRGVRRVPRPGIPLQSGASAHQSLTPLRTAIANSPHTQIRGALLPLIDAAGNDVSRARENIEAWYNSSMDRVSGWYKRRAQQVLLVMGIAVAIITNVDSIALGNSLATDFVLRESVVAAAETYIKENALTAEAPEQNEQSNIEACRSAPNSPECNFQTNLTQIRQLGLPIGWNFEDRRNVPPTRSGADAPAWVLKAIGWIITGLAISLGAPFWFDLLNKFIVIRSTVKPHEKSPEEASED